MWVAVEEAGAVGEVEPLAVVGVVDGAGVVGAVGVTGAVGADGADGAVGADAEPAEASRRAVTIVPLGFGSFVPEGTNPTVMSWSSVNRSVAGLPWTVEGFALEEKAFGQ